LPFQCTSDFDDVFDGLGIPSWQFLPSRGIVVARRAFGVTSAITSPHHPPGFSWAASAIALLTVSSPSAVPPAAFSYRLTEHAAIAGKEDKNKNPKSKPNETLTAEPAR